MCRAGCLLRVAHRLERLAPPVPQRELEQYVAECAVARLARGGVRDACEEEVGGTDADAAHRSFVARQNQRAPQDDSPSYVQQRGGNCVAHFAALSASEGLGPAEFVRRDANGATSDGAQAEKPRGTPRQRAVGSPQATEGEQWEEVSRECGGGELKAVLESAPAEDLDLSLDREREGERHTPAACAIEPNAESRVCEENPIPGLFQDQGDAIGDGSDAAEKPRPYPSFLRASATGRATQAETPRAEELAEIWEQECGALPALRAMTPERVVRCRARLAHARDACAFLAEFREAVRRAASTPFLCGAGPAGWRANFDWFIANGTNYCKVLEGRYDAGGAAPAVPDAGRTSFPPMGKPAAEKIASEKPQGQRPCATQILPLAAGESSAERAGKDAGHLASNQAMRAGHDADVSCAPRNSFAWRDAREAAVQRELRAGSGPQLEPGAARVRPEVLERWKKRHAG